MKLEVDYTKAMFGENAVHLPFNFIRQGDKGKGLILGQETGNNLAFGSSIDHLLVKVDMIFRPHLVIESKHLIGVGAAGIITSSAFCDIDEWKKEGKVLFEL